MVTNNQIAAFLYLCIFNLHESHFGSNAEGPGERQEIFNKKLEELGYPGSEIVAFDNDGDPLIQWEWEFDYYSWKSDMGIGESENKASRDWKEGKGKLWDAFCEALKEGPIDLDAIINKLYAND